MLKQMFKKVDRIFLFIEEWSLFTAVSLALLTAMANVILRKTTNDFNLYWSDEVVRKVIYFSTYIGCVAAIRGHQLIRITALPQVIPALKKPLALFSHLAVLVFAGLMIFLGSKMTLMMYEDEYAKTATLQIPEYYFYAILPIMGFMMFIRTIIAMRESWIGKRNMTTEK